MHTVSSAVDRKVVHSNPAKVIILPGLVNLEVNS